MNGNNNGNKVLKLGIPKGSLQETTISIFKKAGFNIKPNGRSYYPDIDDMEIQCILIRAQEMARYVEEGVIDCGITGNDMIVESNADVVELAELLYAKRGLGKVKWVVAVPVDSEIKKVKDLEGKHIATEAVNLTKKYLEKHGVSARVEFSWGATEAKPPQLADAIIEVTETGESLKENNLRVIDMVMESTTRFIANKSAAEDAWKRNKMEKIIMLLKGALYAEEKVGLKMNIQSKDLSSVLALLPALKKPTINSLTESGWMAIEVIVDERTVRDLIPKLKKAGAEGIIEYPLNKVIF
jgi:ATP phosphoribosyltransferase